MCVLNKIVFIVFILLLTGCSSCNKQEINQPDETSGKFVRANNKLIVDGDGNELILRGVGLGGWMLQEGYMLGTSGAQYEIRELLEDLAGKSATDQFYSDWLSWFVTANDVKQIAEWGYNSIRLPLHYELFFDAGGNWLENSKGLVLTDNLLEWCKNEKLYLILDLHAAPGGQGNNKDISDRREGESLWTSTAAQEQTILMWEELAKKYKDETWIAGYDLINEPNYDFENSGNSSGCNCQVNAPLLDIYEKMIDAIRAIDKNHLIIIEGNCYGGNYHGLESLANYDSEKNIAFSFHYYWGKNQVSSIQYMLNLRDNLNVPLWRGEIGENSNTWFTDMVVLMEQYQIGYANWPWKKINNLDGPVIIPSIPEWDKIIAWKSDKSKPKPSTSEAQTALIKMIENLKLENCRLMHDVAYAYCNSPYGEGSKPYSEHSIPGIIYPTDYDLGQLRESWFDKDYQNTSGSSSNTAWNKGVSYRNDGVDIWPTTDQESNGFFIGKIENGEWLEFSLMDVTSGAYNMKLRTRANNDQEGKISFLLDGKDLIASKVIVPQSKDWQTIEISNVNVQQGNKLRVVFDTGGFDIAKIEFVK